jgi:hypothetical protein
MDVLKATADLAKLQAETMRLLDDVHKTRRAAQRPAPILTVCAFLAVGTGFAAVCVQFAMLFLQWSN